MATNNNLIQELSLAKKRKIASPTDQFIIRSKEYEMIPPLSELVAAAKKGEEARLSSTSENSISAQIIASGTSGSPAYSKRCNTDVFTPKENPSRNERDMEPIFHK